MRAATIEHEARADPWMWDRLENWGRWGRQDPDCPDPEGGTANIYEMGRSKSQSDFNPPEAPNPIKSDDADLLDGYIRQMAQPYRGRIQDYFYRRKHVPLHAMNEAVRMLCDMEQSNAAVNARMRGRV